MKDKLNQTDQDVQKVKMKFQGGSSDTVYALGIIGAWAYYFNRSATFQEGVQGFFKGLVWPAFLVYELFKFLDRNRPPQL